MRKILLIFSFTCIAYLNAQTKILNLKTNLLDTNLSTNRTFKLQVYFEIPELEIKNFTPPSISPFSTDEIKFVSRIGSFSETLPIVQDKDLSFIVRFSEVFLFTPLKEGSFAVSLAQIEYLGQKILSEPTKLTILSQHQSFQPQKNFSEKLTFFSNISNKNPYIGESVKVSLKLFPLSNNLYPTEFLEPSYGDNLFIKTFYIYSNKNPKTIVRSNGIEVTLEEFLVYPLSEGTLTIQPRKIKLNSNGNESIISPDPIVFEVKPTGYPLNGDFTASTQIYPSDIFEGDIFIYSLIISGTGNLITYELPEFFLKKFNFKNLELIKNESSFDFNNEDLSLSTKTFSYSLKLINSSAKIPVLKINYFNTRLHKEATLEFTPPPHEFMEGKSGRESVSRTSYFTTYNEYLTYSLFSLSFLSILAALFFVSKKIYTTRKSNLKTNKNTYKQYDKNIEDEIDILFTFVSKKENFSKVEIETIYLKMQDILLNCLTLDNGELLRSKEKIKNIYISKGLNENDKKIETLIDKIHCIRFSSNTVKLTQEEVTKDLKVLKKFLKLILMI